MPKALFMLFTETGVAEEFVLPSPSWPTLLSPQQRTEPFERSAQEWVIPTAIEIAVLIPIAFTGVVLHGTDGLASQDSGPVLLPFPSWPLPLYPQHFTSPVERAAQECWLPEAIETALFIPVTGTGAKESSLEPLPNAPRTLYPQHWTELSDKRAQE
jgi:hypothetical protein